MTTTPLTTTLAAAPQGVNGVALAVFVFFFLAVTVMGFLAARWRKAEQSANLDEWGLGGRSFGTWVTWFLLGGDLYTAYTFVAVPAAIYTAGAAGFFAVPYTILVYPLIFTFLPRLWSVSHRHGYVTTSDFVRGRFGSKGLSLAVALTGLLATMPYIALQLVGIQAVLDVLGVGGGADANWFVKDLPLLIAFAVLAAYTYSSGLRAPALIAFVKDGLIYLVIVVAIIYIPIKLGGFGEIFHAAKDTLAVHGPTGKPRGELASGPNAQWAYATLALGSALALFMYPHSITATLSSRSRNVIRRNTTILPLYSLMLGLLALLGFMAIKAGTDTRGNAQLAIPQLFEDMFPSWFAGVAFAAIGIGALVPAAIMSIAAANLFTRNVYKDFLKPDATPEQEHKVAKLVSLLVKVGALAFVLTMDKTVAINFQLLGGIWILQTMPALVGGLFTRWFHRWALLAGWAVGMVYGTLAAYGVASPTQKHFGGSNAQIPGIGEIGYIGLTAFVLNVVVTVILTFVLKALKAPEGTDETSPGDYTADVGDAGVTADLPPATAGAPAGH
ncbi:sodium:solute symporter [Streptomyces noursei ZPM]|uniref:Permease n=2 Tax=Streptomyces TaxID=1883 RepID=A0A401R7C3_STRNR|nr:sodium:solute symporter [Streptomyces noursei]AKA05947.1 sodium:solute symporter [Streptomyces noursei ZPM]EOT03167.1 sodium:solute symporter [Streptomyces noursei CCRC 11814]EXU88283.1 sodium:solute symporter [Streptomyces noursei PD-1]UWS74346.1 sodium:solute symporter [Streptomyces noursei]GCB93498.1 permease [Streptomyces noursei]